MAMLQPSSDKVCGNDNEETEMDVQPLLFDDDISLLLWAHKKTF